MKAVKDAKQIIVLLETQIDKMVGAVSNEELRKNSRLRKRLGRLKGKLAELRELTIGPNPLNSIGGADAH